MKNIGEKKSFSAYVMGNYAIARAMLEENVKFITSYPGSPTPEIAEALESVKEKNFYFEFSINEKVALEKAAGASLNGHLSCCFFKSVGLNVAMDSLIQLPMMNLIGGMVIILGDDPGANSSQNEQDNRHFSRMSYMPMLEPSSPKEAYQMLKDAIKISKKLKMPIILRSTTHISHAKELIEFQDLNDEPYNFEPLFDEKNGPYVPVAQTVFPLKEKALKKLETLKTEELYKKQNFLLNFNQNPEKLIITSGLVFSSVLEIVKKNKINCDIMKLGFTYPLDNQFIISNISKYKEVFILEELDNLLEKEIKAICFENDIKVKIHAKKEIKHFIGEITPDVACEILSEKWPEFRKEKFEIKEKISFPRYPQLCPGCGHRSAFFAIKKAISKEDITVADIGCHTMGFLPPYEMGKILFSMGHSVSTGAGLSYKNNKRKVIAFLGDSTLFHAAIPGIINAAIFNSNLILVILENQTTAMTGHQPRIGSGEIGHFIDITKLLEDIGVKFIRKVDAYNQSKLIEYIKEAKNFEGFSVIIAHHPCMLKYTRDMKKKDKNYKTSKAFIDENCNRKMVCVSEFCCPSFVYTQSGAIYVNEDLCIGDGSCVQTCPSKAIKIKREEKK